jgi:hypothetical protein
MGAWGTTYTDLKSRDECKKHVQHFCENEDKEAKDVDFYDKEFKSREEAEEFCNGKADKWGNAAAASYLGLPEKLRETASLKKLEELQKEKFPALQKEINEQLSVMGAIRSVSEIDFAKCDNCQSKVNTKYVLGFSSHEVREMIENEKTPLYGCPACGERSLEPRALKAEMKKLNKIIDRYKKLVDLSKTLKAKIDNENARSIYWCVAVFIPT